jgi:hypothetical protein
LNSLPGLEKSGKFFFVVWRSGWHDWQGLTGREQFIPVTLLSNFGKKKLKDRLIFWHFHSWKWMNKLLFHLFIKSHRLSSRKRDLLHSTHHLNKRACLRFSANVKHDFYTKINKDTLFLTMIQTWIKALMKFKRQWYLFQRYMLIKRDFLCTAFPHTYWSSDFTSFSSQMRKPLHFLLLIISLFRVNADRKVTFFHLSNMATQLKATLKHLAFFL